MQVEIAMAVFALASSITPGPVNTLVFSQALHHGLARSLRITAGATAGFILLLLASGAGLMGLLQQWPSLLWLMQCFGVLYLLYLAYQISRSAASLQANKTPPAHALSGAVLQWLNPKAWLACMAGISAFVPADQPQQLLVFAALYALICFVSVGCWALAGALLQRSTLSGPWLRAINNGMALMLCISAVYWLPFW